MPTDRTMLTKSFAMQTIFTISNGLGKDVELSNQELIDTIQEAVFNTPTAFNSQASRVVILLDEESFYLSIPF